MVLSQQVQLSLQNNSARNMFGVAAHPICLVYVGQRGVHSCEALLNHSGLLTELKAKALLNSGGLGHHPILGKYLKVINAFYNLPVLLGDDVGVTGFTHKCGSKCCNSETLSKISIFLVALWRNSGPLI